MNVIYANDFQSQAIKSGGGKGLLSGGKNETTGFKYFASFMGALGEGDISDLYIVFDDQATYTPSTAPDGKVFELFFGTQDQAVWPPLLDHPDDVYNYTFTAFIGFYHWPLDSSATIPQLNFVPKGIFAGTCPLNLYTAPDSTQVLMDADPAECIYDLLTNTRYGVPVPTSFVDSTSLFSSADATNPAIGDNAVSTYCQAVGFGMSVVLNNVEPASSILDRWCKNMLIAPVWTGTILKFIPYWDKYDGTNPGYDAAHADRALKYYSPKNPILFDLTDLDFIQADEGEDPVTVSRVDPVDVKNVIRIDFRDRYLLYNDSVAEAKDENQVETYGPRVDRMGLADEFTHINYASVSAHIQLKRNIAIRRTFTFKLGWQYCVLEPMDAVSLTDATLGLNKFPVRVQTIEEDEKGVLTFVCEEFPIGATSTILYPQQQSVPPTLFDTGVAPGPVNPPIILEPTPELLTFRGKSLPTIMVGISGGTAGVSDPNWGGANVYVSDDDATYIQFGTKGGPSRQGVTTASLPDYTGSNPDNTNTLSVSLIMSNGNLESVTDAQAASGLSVCAVKDPDGDVEFIGYTTATLTGQNAYDLTGLYRGMFGTTPCAHPTDSQFLRIDDAVFEDSLPPDFIGSLLYSKYQSFNLYGQGLEDLSSVTVYPYTPLGIGSTQSSNPIVLALQAGQEVDLNAADAEWDLNLGGFGDCSPTDVEIDLGTF
jgi:hypothetical protein